MTIRKATTEDTEEIFNIKNKNLLLNKNINNGFLTGDYSKDEYNFYIKNSSYFFVATLNNKIIGFVWVVKSSDNIDLKRINKEINSKEEFVFVKQIAVDPLYKKKGVGVNLYNHIYSIIKGKTIYLYIVKEPENIASENFHKKEGFLFIKEYENNGYKVNLYFKSI